MYFTYDQVNVTLINTLHKLDGVRFFEDPSRDQIVFVLPDTVITTKIIYPHMDKKKKLKTCWTEKNKQKTKKKTKQTKKECDSPFRASFQNIINSITNLNLNSKEKVLSWYENSSKIARRRTNLSFNSGDTIYLSLIKTNYISSHYNCADLSMLADLDDLKKKQKTKTKRTRYTE